MSDKNKKTFIPYIFFIFFGIIFAINIFYIYIAQKSWRGVYTEQSYQKGLKYNESLANVKKQQDLGWQYKISFDTIGNNTGQLKLCLLDKNNKRIRNAKIVVKLTRPVQEGYDFNQDLVIDNDCYFAKISFPLKGLWDFEFIAYKDDNILQDRKRYIVR